jgi:protein phosphatase
MRLDIDAVVMTHAGKVRKHNEDFATYVRPSDRTALASHGVLALVADGMGGHNAGEHASRLAGDTVTRSYFQSTEEPRQALLDALNAANLTVFCAAMENRVWKGMGTTCVAASICNGQVWWAWIGDSRMYLLRGGKIYQLTEDHTVVQEMVRNGWMTQEEARMHRDRNVLERALGTRRGVNAGIGDAALWLEAGDRLLLCSDGLHDLLNQQELAEMAGEAAVASSAERLVQAALARGGHDNVSIVLLEARTEPVPRQPAQTREYELA